MSVVSMSVVSMTVISMSPCTHGCATGKKAPSLPRWNLYTTLVHGSSSMPYHRLQDDTPSSCRPLSPPCLLNATCTPHNLSCSHVCPSSAAHSLCLQTHHCFVDLSVNDGPQSAYVRCTSFGSIGEWASSSPLLFFPLYIGLQERPALSLSRKMHTLSCYLQASAAL
jgi:hypothetical protein